VFIPAAGVMAGAMIPLMAIGFADEYSIWTAMKKART
jgi:hypothetical protein